VTTRALQKRRVRIAPNLYQRPADGKFEAGLSIHGRWTMKTLKARTKTEARKELAQLQAKAATQEQQREQQSCAVATVTAAWLESFALQVARGERSARTLDHYRSNFRCHVEPHFGSSDLAAIGPDEIVAFYDTLRRQGKSPYVLRACNDVLSRIFKFAIRRGLIETSAVAKLEPGERPRPRKAEQRILTHGEIKALLHHAEGDAFDLIALHLFTGMRQGEILGLRWGRVDFDAGVIYVREQLQRPRDGEQPTVNRPKTPASVRDVVLLPQLAAALARRRLAASFSNDNDFVFSAGPETPIHYSRANRLLRQAVTSAEIPHLKSHDFRHTYASHLIIDLGLDVEQVRGQLGHAKASITSDKYTHLFDRARHGNALREQMAQSAFGALLHP
jgi:integrase